MRIRQLGPQDERWLRKWMLTYDIDFAFHRQLKDYFLQETTNFGCSELRSEERVDAISFWSRHKEKSFIHCWMGSTQPLENMRLWLNLPCQLYLRSNQITANTPGDKWKSVLTVTPGYVIDHSAYEGVFSRVVPRFAGTVFEHE